MKCLKISASFTLTIIFILSKNVETKVSYRDAQVWRADLESDKSRLAIVQLSQQLKFEILKESNNYADIVVMPSYRSIIMEKLTLFKINHQIFIADLQKEFDRENLERKNAEQQRASKFNVTGSYYNTKKIHQYMKDIAKNYSNICKLSSIGKSVEGRDLKMLKIFIKGKKRPAVWIDGGTHGREWISPAVVTYIINQLTVNRKNQPQEVKDIDWHILPILNPDGYEYSRDKDRLWRKNRKKLDYCHGVDLNRNFDYKWLNYDHTGSVSQCSDAFGGKTPFSERETKAIKSFFKSNRKTNFQGFITFHSYTQKILLPWAYDRISTKDNDQLLKVANSAVQKIKTENGVNYVAGNSAILVGYKAAGTACDWAKGKLNITYTYTVELRDTGGYGFALPANEIEPTGKDAMVFIKELAKAIKQKNLFKSSNDGSNESSNEGSNESSNEGSNEVQLDKNYQS